MPALTLVKVRQEYFPYAQADFDLLTENSVAVFRIPSQILPLLTKTSLKGVTINTLAWSETWESLRAAFLRNLEKDGLRFKVEDTNQLVIKYTEEQTELAENHLKSLSTYVTRYGFKSRHTYKRNSDSTLVRVVIALDPDADPSSGFNQTKTSFKQVHHLNLSPVARLNFNFEVVHTQDRSTTLFTLVFEDSLGGSWQENFRRAFDLKRVKKQELLTFISSMTAMLGSMK